MSSVVVRYICLMIMLMGKCYASCDIQDAFIIQNLAQAKWALLNDEPIVAYANTKSAIMVIEESEEDLDHHLFLALFIHVISCERLDYRLEMDSTLKALDSLKALILSSKDHCALDSEDASNDYSKAYLNLVDMSNLISNEQIKNELQNIAQQLFHDEIAEDMPKTDQLVLQRKKIWKRSLNWWREQIDRTLDKADVWIDLAQKCQDLYNKINNIIQNKGA